MTGTSIDALVITAKFKNKLTNKHETVDTTIVNMAFANNKQEVATIGYLSNKFGIGVAAIVKVDEEKSTLLIPSSTDEEVNINSINIASGSLQCTVCQHIVKFINNLPTWGSCKVMCGLACLVFIEMPPVMLVCNLICNPVCKYLTENPSSGSNAYRACCDMGYCP